LIAFCIFWLLTLFWVVIEVKNLHFRKGGDVQCVLLELIFCFHFLLLETNRKESVRKSATENAKQFCGLPKEIHKEVLRHIVESTFLCGGGGG
jgi:hypothetical protein